MKRITRRDILKLMGKVVAVTGVGMAMPSVLIAKEMEFDKKYFSDGLKKEIDKIEFQPITNTGPWVHPLDPGDGSFVHRSGYLQIEPSTLKAVDTVTVAGSTNSNGKWIMVDQQNMRPVK